MDKILAQAAAGTRNDSGAPAGQTEGEGQKPLPKGVVIGKDGKPCRSCTSAKDWIKLAQAQSGQKKPSSTSTSSASSTATGVAAGTALTTTAAEPTSTYPSDCPPDVETLGNHTWTLLHSLSAQYPERASTQQQADMGQFLNLFGKLYPCWVCAEDFQQWKSRKENEPRLGGRSEFGTWMCEAHNEVNRKLGKKEFDCKRWEERWRDGWKDGRCG